MRPQVRLRRVQRRTQAGRGQNVAERLPRGRRHARSGRCHKPSSARAREFRKRIPNLVFIPACGLPLNKNVVATKGVHEPVQDSACEHHAPGSQSSHERPSPPAGEDDELTSGFAQIDEVVAGIALTWRVQRSLTHRSHELRVSAGAGCQDGQAHPRVFCSGSESPPRGR